MSASRSGKRKLFVPSEYVSPSGGTQREDSLNVSAPVKTRKLHLASKPYKIEKFATEKVLKSLKRAYSESDLHTGPQRKKIFLSEPSAKIPVDKEEEEKPVPGTSGTQPATVNKGNRRKKTRRGKRKPRGLAAYEIGACIGSGGFGDVFAATRKRDRLPVAIKFVKKAKVNNFKEINGQLFPMEAYYQRHVRHPNVIELLDVFIHEDNVVYVLERPKYSSDLLRFINAGDGITEEEGRRLFTHILEATIQCEAQGVLHRDIKPENIIVDLKKQEAKLTDFGLACETQEHPFRCFVGTRLYCPPEFFSHHYFFGTQATVWQLGIVLNEMLSGEMPYSKPRMALHMRPSISKYLSTEARSLIAWLLARDPDQRPTLEQIRSHPWINQPKHQ